MLNAVNIPAGNCKDADGTTTVPAIEISQSTVSPYSASDVTIELQDANTLNSPDGHAGIQVTSGNTLKIIGDGTLNVTGGKGGAGIGNAGENDASGEIIIETDPKGKITAQGGLAAAGIGGGQGGGCGKITINSGKVNATGGDGYEYKGAIIKGGAGIGTGGQGKGGGGDCWQVFSTC